MAENVKRMVAVAFLVASVPVLLLPGKFHFTFATGPGGALTSQEGDRLAKELLALRQQVSALKGERTIQGVQASASPGESRRLIVDNGTREQEHDVHPVKGTKNAPLRGLNGFYAPAPDNWICVGQDPRPAGFDWTGWTLLLSSDLASSSIGDFSSGAQVGSEANFACSDYRIGKTGAQLQSEGMSGVRVTTLSGRSFEFLGTLYPSGFDNTCTTCNCHGNSIGSGFWWHGGRGGCYGSTHFGLKKESDVHSTCNDGNADDSAWGHFHRSGVNTGVYFFGDACINENEWQERFFFWARPGKPSTLARRAVYTRWGSQTCPMGSMLLYSGFISKSRYTHSGSGYNTLCMHPNPQRPSGWDAANNDGALLYGVEYENTGAIDKNHNHDAACAVCQWQNGGSVYVEWGNGESRDNPSTPKTCGNLAHEMIYTGLIMSEHYTHKRSEYICVDLERAYHGEAEDSDDDHNGGLLYTTEMEQGSADEDKYPHNREVGCTVCGIPARSIDADGVVTVTPELETDVFTMWGKKQCDGATQQVYTGFMAGGYYGHSGSGANYVCMTTDNANAPSGYSDGNQDGARLYGTEYKDTGAIDLNGNGDAACVVCRYLTPQEDVYVQWGRSNSCSNTHTSVYQGYVMGDKFTHYKSTHLCVHTNRETHAQSSWSNDHGALLYTTEFERSVSGASINRENLEVGCSSCAGSEGKSVFTRWGSRSCPDGSAGLLYEGTMMAERYTHIGGGANTICMHPTVQTPSGFSSGNQDGNSLYTMEYQDTGAIDAHHDHEAACAVCEMGHWESVYTQWGRSTTCTNGHVTLYTGFIMAERYTHNKGEFICVDSERAVIPTSHSGDQNGGLLYSTEMEQGSTDEEKYPHNVEVGCSVCAAQAQANEVPFVMQTQVRPNGESYYTNAIHGEWVKIASLATGQSMTVSYGYTASGGTSSSEGETKSSAHARAHDVSMCASTSFTASVENTVSASATAGAFGVSSTVGVSATIGFSSTVGLEACGGETTTEKTSVARVMTHATSWDQSITESRSHSLYIPSQLPAGVPEAETIQTLGVDVWQWQWTIYEGAHDGVSAKIFKAKAESRFVLAPEPTGATERRPCCKPGQEYGTLWYPFNCKTSEGLLMGAENVAHCKVGPPGSSEAEQWSEQQVVEWLSGLDLSQGYGGVVAARKLDGPAIDSLLRFVALSPASYNAMANVFGAIPSGDSLKILRGLIRLRAGR